ncbi:putative ABC transport system permease protein [Parabacteroides sp. PF5-5]|uniref:ABC transporter permease n=1 Tax=unclassified Parabacteroides TaxID=2649774 RepID=UPI002475813F|nr:MULTISPECIES: ABC transporter permease [unclassified Parabacteroides]MDH6304545.1 putative ABC transport system permease protein [Parabacteroides sp. PH5-39]MDH6315303.1 putative ABC transport system permease protein [Parabacteroides sp. PF5-13]MDH6319203.1 putative ABC transport system permease protein [Parabacteroides sp. PH5-13]MDH6322934.1 putative ABC transport system permease protein [Parabacteroides sp. PH5-8]MDH6326494.1 putative ABC transport system permease protein [Parabacteroide
MKTIIKNFLSALRRFKMATVLNILGLSIAFAAFIIIFMQLDYDWNFDKCHTNSDRIYRVEINYDGTGQVVISRPLSDRFIASSPHIQAGSIVNPWGGNLYFSVDRDGEQLNFLEPSVKVYPEFTDVFEFEMLEGVTAALQEPNKVLIPQSMAKRLYGNASAMDQQLKGENFSYTIGGVYKDFPQNTVVSNCIYAPFPKDENLQNWGNNNYVLYVRVDNPKNSEHLVENFKKNFDTSALGSDYAWVAGINLRLTPLPEIHFVTDTVYDSAPKASKQTLLVLFGIAFIIVAIAGINFTNFSTALTPVRIKGINTQKILGADESALRLSLLMEAVSISIVSYLLGLLLVFLFSLTPMASLINAEVSLLAYPSLILGVGVLAILTGLLAGLYPSYYTTSFSPALVLKGGFGLSPKGRQLRNVLISIQFISSFALIIGAMFMYLQNYYMQNTPLGYDKDELIITNVTNTLNKSQDAFTNQLKTFAGIENVTFAEPLLSSSDQYMGWGRKYRDKDIQFQCLPVDYSFLKVMNINVVQGRDFREEDKNTTSGVYIFNEKARDMYGLETGEKIDDGEIVGFIPDVKFASFRTEVTPMAFYVWGTENWGSRPNHAYIKVKAGSDLRAAMKHVRTSLEMFDAKYPFNVRFFNEVLHKLYEKEQKTSSLITLFSLIAVFISIVGVFGLVVFESEYRKKEIGLRKVLGSSTNEILAMFNRIYIRILCICFVLAAPIAYYAIIKWLENFAYKTPVYWWVFAIAFLLIAIITIFTVTFQNWRAANANPVESIKTE